MRVLERPTRNLFFTGKGGVGKTSTSCAVAVALADRGKAVLLVSTDPASNLDEVFDTPLAHGPVAIAAVPGLHAMNVDPEAAAAAYRERVVGPYRALLPADAVASIEEQLAGACTVEIAAFDEFAKLIGDRDVAARYDHIVFDTAPTGHTLRLLALPAAWSGFFGSSVSGTSCVGPLQGMAAQRDLYAAAVATLSDPSVTTMTLVSRPERSALAEAERTSAELAELGVRNQSLVLNGVFQPQGKDDPVAVAMHRQERAAMAAMPPRIAALERSIIPLKPRQVVGVAALRGFFSSYEAEGTLSLPRRARALPEFGELIAQLEAGGRGLVMTMGKGGVGKTTLASRIAVELAGRGFPVHLTTTDPAAHIAGAVGRVPANLTIGEINPRLEVERYRAEVMATTGAKLDANGRALLAGGFELAVHRGNRGVPGVRTRGRGGRRALRGRRYRAHGTHDPAARRRAGVSQGSDAPGEERDGGGAQPASAAARPGIHAHRAVHAGGGDAGARGGGAAARPAPRGHRALRMGGQPEPRAAGALGSAAPRAPRAGRPLHRGGRGYPRTQGLHPCVAGGRHSAAGASAAEPVASTA